MSNLESTDHENLVTASKDDVISALPDKEAESDHNEVILRFVGQAWIDGVARDVDESETTYSVPVSDLRTDDGWALDETPYRHFVADGLHTHENAPEWVQNWNGPFELQVKHCR